MEFPQSQQEQQNQSEEKPNTNIVKFNVFQSQFQEANQESQTDNNITNNEQNKEYDNSVHMAIRSKQSQQRVHIRKNLTNQLLTNRRQKYLKEFQQKNLDIFNNNNQSQQNPEFNIENLDFKAQKYNNLELNFNLQEFEKLSIKVQDHSKLLMEKIEEYKQEQNSISILSLMQALDQSIEYFQQDFVFNSFFIKNFKVQQENYDQLLNPFILQKTNQNTYNSNGLFENLMLLVGNTLVDANIQRKLLQFLVLVIIQNQFQIFISNNDEIVQYISAQFVQENMKNQNQNNNINMEEMESQRNEGLKQICYQNNDWLLQLIKFFCRFLEKYGENSQNIANNSQDLGSFSQESDENQQYSSEFKDALNGISFLLNSTELAMKFGLDIGIDIILIKILKSKISGSNLLILLQVVNEICGLSIATDKMRPFLVFIDKIIEQTLEKIEQCQSKNTEQVREKYKYFDDIIIRCLVIIANMTKNLDQENSEYIRYDILNMANFKNLLHFCMEKNQESVKLNLSYKVLSNLCLANDEIILSLMENYDLIKRLEHGLKFRTYHIMSEISLTFNNMTVCQEQLYEELVQNNKHLLKEMLIMLEQSQQNDIKNTLVTSFHNLLNRTQNMDQFVYFLDELKVSQVILSNMYYMDAQGKVFGLELISSILDKGNEYMNHNNNNNGDGGGVNYGRLCLERGGLEKVLGQLVQDPFQQISEKVLEIYEIIEKQDAEQDSEQEQEYML